MTAFTLDGGCGPFTPRWGLGLDSLLEVELILADGRKIVADSHEHPDLFWALRGGGENFGVVTAMRMRLHPAVDLLAGTILVPAWQAQAVLRGYAGVAASAPDELSVAMGFLCGPGGDDMLFLSPAWSGERHRGGAFVDL